MTLTTLEALNFYGPNDFDNYVFVDCETSGLDVNYHQLIDFSWAVGLFGEIYTVQISTEEFSEMIESASFEPVALRVNGYDDYVKFYPEQGIHQANGEYPQVSEKDVTTAANLFHKQVKGKTLVGANPAFDAAFIKKFLGSRNLFVGDEVVRDYDRDDNTPWHYRLFDIQAAFGGWVFGAGLKTSYRGIDAAPMAPPLMGLKDIVDFFQKRGYGITSQGDVHTSDNDVMITRDCFFAMLLEQRNTHNK